MAFIAWFLWILIWSLTGYLTVRAIILHVQKRRMEKAMAAYMQHQMLMTRCAGMSEGKPYNLYPFADLSKEDLV